jgi:hypothetical protein
MKILPAVQEFDLSIVDKLYPTALNIANEQTHRYYLKIIKTHQTRTVTTLTR